MEIIKTKKGCLSVLGGKHDMGKSTIACFDCADHIRSGMNVMFFSYEYCQSIIYNKLVTHFDLKFQELFSLNVVDARGWSLELLEKAIRRAKGTVEVVYIDYLDLVGAATYEDYQAEGHAKHVEYRQTMMAELAKLAYELQISIVVLTRLHAAFNLNDTIDYLNLLTAGVTTPEPAIKMFIARDEVLNPMIKDSDMSHVIEVEGNGLAHFSSINLKQAYKY